MVKRSNPFASASVALQYTQSPQVLISAMGNYAGIRSRRADRHRSMGRERETRVGFYKDTEMDDVISLEAAITGQRMCDALRRYRRYLRTGYASLLPLSDQPSIASRAPGSRLRHSPIHEASFVGCRADLIHRVSLFTVKPENESHKTS